MEVRAIMRAGRNRTLSDKAQVRTSTGAWVFGFETLRGSPAKAQFRALRRPTLFPHRQHVRTAASGWANGATGGSGHGAGTGEAWGDEMAAGREEARKEKAGR